jgi:hypothetical protein
MEMRFERRLDPRVRVQVRLVLADEVTGVTHVMYTTNLSAGGACCTTLSGIPAGAVLAGSLFLPLSEGGRDVDVAVPVRARVARELGDGATARRRNEIALTFELSDIDRDELRRFLLDWLAADSWSHACVGAREA